MAPRVNAADVCWDNDRLANPVEVALPKVKHRLFLATTFPVPLNWQPHLRRCNPCSAALQPLFCQKTGDYVKA
jgi:hypothetical protein